MDMRMIVVSALQLLMTLITSAEEVCIEENFEPACSADEVVIIEQAQYGRMYSKRCITSEFGHVGAECTVNVKRDLDLLCSGRQNCEVKVSDGLFPGHVPCHRDLISFLDVTYSCLKVIRTKDQCHGDTTETVTDAEGYLSSHVAHDTECGTTQSPWRVKSRPGQRINVTMYDFSYDINQSGGLGQGKCTVYATIKDVSKNSPSTICGGSQEQPQVVAVSTGNELEIRFILPPPERGQIPYYLLHFKAIGCPDPDPDPNQSMERLHSDVLKLTCQSTGHVTRFTCEDEVWVGHTQDCPAVFAVAESTLTIRPQTLPHALAITVIVAIAVCVSAAILCIGVLCLRRNPQYAQHQHAHAPPPHGTMKLVAVQQGPDYKTTHTKLISTADHEMNTIGRGQERMRHMYALTAGLHPDKTRDGEGDNDAIRNENRPRGVGANHGNRPHHIYETPAELLAGSPTTHEQVVAAGNGICGLCGMSDNMCFHRRLDSRDALIEKIHTTPRATNNYSV